jgi:hypothetical protein
VAEKSAEDKGALNQKVLEAKETDSRAELRKEEKKVRGTSKNTTQGRWKARERAINRMLTL